MLRVFPRRYRTFWIFATLIVSTSFFYLYQLNMNANLPDPEEINIVEKTEVEEIKINIAELYNPSDKVITFYYPWYGNPTHNDQWIHWNHQILVDNGKFYIPPDDVGANFYPTLGPYSSTDPAVIDQHMKWMAESRIGVLCTSWWGRSASDSQLEHVKGFTDNLVIQILDAAHKYGLKVAFHLEPYKGRNAGTVKGDLRYLSSTYGNHPAVFRDNANRPFIFVYDSYHTNYNEWATILHPNSPDTIRHTDHDAVMIALYVDMKDQTLITKGYFDGFYTYFATDGFTQGSTVSSWPQLNAFAKQHSKIFIPSVGPGYSDTRIRPWNTANQRGREGGQYYNRMFQSAINLNTEYISITSFNEWHEGTQIEPSDPKEVPGFKYEDFSPNDPEYYLRQTRKLIDLYHPANRF